VVAGARNHLRADRSLAFRFEVTAWSRSRSGSWRSLST